MSFLIRYPNIFASDNHPVASVRDALNKIATHCKVSAGTLAVEEYLPGTTFVYEDGIVVAAIVEMIDREESRTSQWVWDSRIPQKFHLARLEAYALGQERQWYHAP